jgi:tetratricopeptide (TPR) repeat protein
MMKKWLAYIFVMLGISAIAQSAFSRARAFTSSGKFAESLGILDSCSKTGYYSDSALYFTGIIHLQMNRTDEAKKCNVRLKKSYATFTETYYLSGLINFSQGDYGKSIDDFTTVLKENPNHIKALYNRSLAFGLLEQYPFAIRDLDACIKIDPRASQAYYSRAYWHEFTGNYSEASKDYEETIKLDPRNLDAYLGLAYIYKHQNDNTRACEMIHKAVEAGSQIAEEIRSNYCK